METGENVEVQALDAIPLGHKIALIDMNEDDTVLKYSSDIGRMIAGAKIGNHVHVQTAKQRGGKHESSKSFLGYRRENGRVGIRNYVVILPLDDLSNARQKKSLPIQQAVLHCHTIMGVYNSVPIWIFTLER